MDNIVLNAARIAAHYHRAQKRDNGLPYFQHLARVAGRVMALPDSTEVMAAAAFGHDLIEDTPIAIYPDIEEAISNHCGLAVLDMVLALTNPSKLSVAPRAERKKQDRDHLKGTSMAVKTIKLIDRIDNLTECLSDIYSGRGKSAEFCVLYCQESELLLTEALAGTNADLEIEFQVAIDLLFLKASKISLTKISP